MSNRKKKEAIRQQQEQKQKIKNILFAIVAVLVAAAIAVGIYFLNREEPKAPPAIGTIVNRQSTDINGVEISTGEIDYSLRLNELLGMFIVEGYESDLLDHFTAAASVIYAVDDVSYTEKIEDVKDLSEYGLKDTKKSVRVTYTDGTEYKLLIGDKCGDFEYYAMLENDSVVYKMLATDCEKLMVHPKEYRIKDICEVDPTTVKSVIVEKKGEKEVEVVKDENYKPTNEYQTISFLMKYPYENITASLGTLQKILDELEDFDAADIAEEKPENLEKYGLVDGTATVLKVTDATGTKELKFGTIVDEKAYVMCAGKDVVYTIPSYLAELLKDYRAVNYVEDFVGIYNIQDVSNIVVAKGKETHTLKMSQDSDGADSFFIDDERVEDKQFRKIYQYVIGITFEDVVEKEPSGKTYMTVKYNFKDSDSVTYTYYEYDEKYCIVKANNGLNCLTLKSELDAAFENVSEGI